MIKKAVETLEKLHEFFQNGDNELSRNLVAAIFPDSLMYDGDSFRTTRINEGVRLIFNVDAGFGGNENEKSPKRNKKSSMDTCFGSTFNEKSDFQDSNVRTTFSDRESSLELNAGAGYGNKKSGFFEKCFEKSTSVARPGFEPRQTEPKSVVLPLYYRAIRTFLSNGVQK